VILGLTGLYSVAQSPSEIPDPSANFRTIIPHRDSIPVPAPLTEFPQENEPFLPNFFSFSGSPYFVGATIDPTTTVPEAEEHIAVDPNNFNHLIAMISDFSLNGGFNTSKYAFSSNDGSSWSQHFVPLSGGFPATADGHIWQANSDPVVAMDKLGNVFLANLYLQVKGNKVTNDGYYVCSATLASGPTFKQSGCHAGRTTLTESSNLPRHRVRRLNSRKRELSKFFEALASEMECLPESAAQVAASGAYGDMPLVVLSAGDATIAKTMEQEAVARLSSNGKIIVVPNSGHWIQLDQPQVVIDAIRKVLQSVRRCLVRRMGDNGRRS